MARGPRAEGRATSERTQRFAAMLGTAVLVPLVVATLQSVRDRPRTMEPPPPVRTVACPQVRVTSSDLPERGWLGAAAGTLACDRIRLRLGGSPERALPPSALYARNGDAAALAPSAFEKEDAAASQRVMANAHADAILEGELAQGKDFAVTLRLVDRIGNELGKGNGAHVSLVGAIRMASDMLTDEAGLSHASGDPYLARTMPGASLDAILATHDLAVHALIGDEEELTDACESVSARSDLGSLSATVAAVCDPWGGRPDHPAAATDEKLRALFFDGRRRGDPWLPWERLASIRRPDADAGAD